MRRLLFVLLALPMGVVAHAACPSGFEEIQMENAILTDTGGVCPSGQASYYHIDEMCTGNLY